jgi:hypothetical protein
MAAADNDHVIAMRHDSDSMKLLKGRPRRIAGPPPKQRRKDSSQ